MFSLNKTPSALKRRLLLIVFFLIASQTPKVQAQSEASVIDSLAVDIWPEYDREAVLVLLTGFLPANASLPATITIPVPENADITAVARITDEGDLFDDITFNESNGKVTLTTPDPSFRVEYYMPYNLDGEARSFTFEWQADTAVTEMLVSVQQPVATDDLTTDPAVFSVTTRQDGFQYHNLSPFEVPAGEPFALDVTYSRSVTQLSAELLQPTAAAETTIDQSQTPSGTRLNWQTMLLASGGVAILAVGAWMLFGERLAAAQKAPVKPRPVRQPTRPKAREMERETAVVETPTPAFVQFCHHCGQKIEPHDRFCRTCGAKLKT